MWPIQLAFIFIVYRIFLSCLIVCITSSIVTWSVKLILYPSPAPHFKTFQLLCSKYSTVLVSSLNLELPAPPTWCLNDVNRHSFIFYFTDLALARFKYTGPDCSVLTVSRLSPGRWTRASSSLRKQTMLFRVPLRHISLCSPGIWKWDSSSLGKQTTAIPFPCSTYKIVFMFLHVRNCRLWHAILFGKLTQTLTFLYAQQNFTFLL